MPAPTEILSVTQWNTLLRACTSSGATLVVDFHAEWCGPCKTIAPVFKKLAEDYLWVAFCRVDVDQQKNIAAKYNVRAMPTFVAIQSGTVVSTLKGADPSGLKKLVAEYAGPDPPMPKLSAEAEPLRLKANEAFKQSLFPAALSYYDSALLLAPTSPVLLSNRSLCHLKLASPAPALLDAEECVRLAPTWAKGHIRMGDALAVLGREKDAVRAYEEAGRAKGLGEKGAEEVRKKLEEVRKVVESQGK